MKKTVPLILSAIVFLSSCTVSQALEAQSALSGTAETKLEVDQFFLDLLEDFSDFESKSGYSIMDEAMLNLTDRINSSSSSSSVKLLTDGNSRKYVISFDYSNLEKLVYDLNGGKDNTLLSLEDNKVALNLTYDNYDELESVIPFLSDPNFEVYGPRYSNGMTEEEYKDMISFLLGEEGVEALEKSFVSIDIRTPGDITGTKGAMKIGSRRAVFSFPIIDFLLLNEPLTFSVEWK